MLLLKILFLFIQFLIKKKNKLFCINNILNNQIILHEYQGNDDRFEFNVTKNFTEISKIKNNLEKKIILDKLLDSQISIFYKLYLIENSYFLKKESIYSNNHHLKKLFTEFLED